MAIKDEKLSFDPEAKTNEVVEEQAKTNEVVEDLPFELKDKKRVVVQITTGIQYDSMTGKKIGKDFIMSFTEQEFEQWKQYAEALGYKYRIRYQPKYTK